MFCGIFCENKQWIVAELDKAQSWSKAVHPSKAPVAFSHNGSTPDSDILFLHPYLVVKGCS